MSKTKHTGNAITAAVLAAVFGISIATGALVLTCAPAYAQTALSGDQIASIQSSLNVALQAANGDTAAIETAISQAVQNAVTLYGNDSATAVASAVRSTAEQAGVLPNLIGTGLAQAAAALSVGHGNASTAIASNVANEGRTDEVAAFQSTSTSLGHTNLASLAGSNGTPVGETGGNGGGGLTGNGAGGASAGGGGGSGGGGGCLNPSCTSL